MKKATIAAIACAVVLPIGGWFGYDAYATSRDVASLHAQVKLASLHISSVLETENSSNATYGEFIRKADASVEELDKVAMQVKLLATVRNKYASDGVLEYVSNGQEIIRDLVGYSRASLRAGVIRERNLRGEFADFVKAVDEEESRLLDVHPRLILLEKQSAWAGRTFGEDGALPSKLVLDTAKGLEKIANLLKEITSSPYSQRLRAAPACSPSDFTVSSLKFRRAGSDVRFTGTVTNRGSNACGVQLKFSIYDPQGAVADTTDFWPASIRNIDPGASENFWYFIRYQTGMEKFHYEVIPISVKTWVE